jgi:hypothetical protein
MKHYVAIIKNDSRALFEYPDRKTAIASFHHEMEYAINANITTVCVVLTENGDTVAKEKYTAPHAPVEMPEGDAE